MDRQIEVNKRVWRALKYFDEPIADQRSDVEDSINYFQQFLRTHVYNLALDLATYQPKDHPLYNREDAKTCAMYLWQEAIYLLSIAREFEGISIFARGHNLESTQSYVDGVCKAYTWEEWKKVSELAEWSESVEGAIKKSIRC